MNWVPPNSAASYQYTYDKALIKGGVFVSAWSICGNKNKKYQQNHINRAIKKDAAASFFIAPKPRRSVL
ncbi:hypothetical protein [Aeromonas jandaei]|uniref:hypothetical protein n=1 Tax=Aeromonas jandaei TaxID=650 RepID=UPI001ADDA371|nr:hypothetical protein [Aeromonas jandaei]